MSGARGVLNYAGCFAETAGSIDRVSGWEAGLRDGLGYIHDVHSPGWENLYLSSPVRIL